MRFVIVGASRFGVATALQMIEFGHDVVLVDQDRTRLEELGDTLDAGFIHGDGTLPTTLRDAYGDAADGLVLLTNEDDVNILSAVVGRSVGFERVVPQIVRRELLDVCDELGLENVITPHETVAHSIVRSLEHHSDMSVDLRMHESLRILRYDVSAQLDGWTVGDLDMPRNTRLIARIPADGGDEVPVTDGTRLKVGDGVLVVLDKDSRDKLNDFFASKDDE